MQISKVLQLDEEGYFNTGKTAESLMSFIYIGTTHTIGINLKVGEVVLLIKVGCIGAFRKFSFPVVFKTWMLM